MTTSELWAKDEAEKGYTPPPTSVPFSQLRSPAQAWHDGAEWGLLHVLSLLESEQAVEAAGRTLYVHWDEWDDDDAQAQGERQLVASALAAVVAAITNQETGGSDS